MNKNQIPEGYHNLMPYLILKNAIDFVTFAKEVLAAKEKMCDLDENGAIRHCELFVGDSTLMISEAREEWPPQNSGIFVYVPNADAAYARALELGSESIMPPADQSYGRSCGVLDPFGNTWWLTHPI